MKPQSAMSRFDKACALAAAKQPDLAAARCEFAAAAAEGDVRGALVSASFLAGGIGGPRDWQGALAILRQWSGRDALAARQMDLISAMDLTGDGLPRSVPSRRPLHGAKRIEMVERLLTPAECGFLIEMAAPRLQPAPVLAAPDEARVRPVIRDAAAAMFRLAEEPPFLGAVNARIAAATRTEVRRGEPLQIMRYRPGQQYRPHVDGVAGGANKRVMTAIIYLNDGYEGGATAFTELGLAVRGRPGDMLLFRNLDEAGELDRNMRHAGLPVTHGVKFIASRWILQRPPYDEHGSLIGTSIWS